MKVIFLTGEYPPMQGGIADHTACLAQYLIPQGVEPSVLMSRRWQEIASAPTAGEHHLPTPPIYPLIPNWGWRTWPAVSGFLKKHRPDVLHIQYQAAAFDLKGWVNWLPWYLKKGRSRTCVVTTFHDLRIPYLFPKAGPLRRRSMLALARYSDGVICTNQEDFNQLANERSPRLNLIPLGSNVEPQPPPGYDRDAWRRQYGATPETLLLAYFGFLNESKGGEELIEALALLRQGGVDARLLFIGGEVGHADPTNVAYAEKVQALIDRHHLAEVVYRTGYTDLSHVSANLLAADVVVMPYRDGVSFRRTTLIAALRHGRPVVSTRPADPGLMPEIKPGQNMLLAPAHNSFGLAETIAPLAGNAALQEKLATGAKALGNLFDWDRIAQETAALYRTVAN
jgi:glycosyltransferase involved in cell wall biosynthesis